MSTDLQCHTVQKSTRTFYHLLIYYVSNVTIIRTSLFWSFINSSKLSKYISSSAIFSSSRVIITWLNENGNESCHGRYVALSILWLNLSNSSNSTKTIAISMLQDDATRATNDDATSCKKSAVQRGYWRDPYIQYFIRSGERKSPEIHRGYYVRVKGINNLTKQFLEVCFGFSKSIFVDFCLCLICDMILSVAQLLKWLNWLKSRLHNHIF